MTKTNSNIEIWDKIYEKNGSNLLLPSEMFVRLFHKYIKREENSIVLDYGCGTGSNLLYMLEKEVEVHGIEVSQFALDIVYSKLVDTNNKAKLTLFDGKTVPYKDDFFDVVVAWQVLYYNDVEGFQQCMREINRVLKPGGLFIGTMCAVGDISYEQSEQIGQNIFLSKVPSQQNAVCIIVDKKDLVDFFPQKNINVGEMMYEFDGVKSRHWVIMYEN